MARPMTLYAATLLACAALTRERDAHAQNLYRIRMAVEQAIDPQYREIAGPREIDREERHIAEIDAAIKVLRNAMVTMG